MADGRAGVSAGDSCIVDAVGEAYRIILVGVVGVEEAHQAEEGLGVVLRRLEEIDCPVGGPFAHVRIMGVMEFAPAVAGQRGAEGGGRLVQPARISVERAVHRYRGFEAPFVDVEPVIGVSLPLLLHAAADVELAEKRGAVAGLAPQPFCEQGFGLGQVVVDAEHAMIGNRLARKDAGAGGRADGIVDRAGFEKRTARRETIQIGRRYP